MTTIYKVEIGHSIDTLNLITLNPQPSNGEYLSEWLFSDQGGPAVKVPHCIFRWNVLQSLDMYAGILTAFGLQTELSSAVTIQARDEMFGTAIFEGIAIRPEFGKNVIYETFFVRNVAIYINNLIQILE